MAFAKSTQARLPHFPGYPGTFTTLQTSLHDADRPVAPPRFDSDLSTGPGSFTTGDLGVSPDRTFTSWLTRVIARLRHDHSFTVVVIAPEQLDARGIRFTRDHPAHLYSKQAQTSEFLCGDVNFPLQKRDREGLQSHPYVTATRRTQALARPGQRLSFRNRRLKWGRILGVGCAKRQFR